MIDEGDVQAPGRGEPGDRQPVALYRPDRRHQRSASSLRARAASSASMAWALVVVDYLQLLAGSARRANEGRVQEVGEITTGLKALAKELNVPMLALSQLSRAVENREDKRPQLADLRELGLDRAGCRRRHVRVPGRVLFERAEAHRKARSSSRTGRARWA